MGLFTDLYGDLRECSTYATQEEKDACMIRKGFQVTGPNQYSRTTGTPVSPEQVAALASFAIPAVAPAVTAVRGAVTAVKGGSSPGPLQNPAAVPTAPTTAPASGSAQLAGFGDAGSLFLIAGVAIVALFAMRRR